MKVGLLPHQAKACLNTTKPIILLCGGLGSAKSYAGAAFSVINMLRAPGLPGGAGCPTSAQLRDYVVPAVRKCMEDTFNCREGKEWTHFRSTGQERITLAQNGSEVWFRSFDKDSTVVGNNLAWGWVDEPGLVKDAAIKKFKARIRASSPMLPDDWIYPLLMTGTPEGMNGLFYEWAEGDPPVFPDDHPRAGEPMSLLIRARTGDNPFLPEDYIATSLIGFTDAEKEAYVNGRFVPPKGRVYTQFDKDRHVTPCNYRVSGDVVMLCDFNRTPMWWTFAVVRGEQMHVFEEFIGENTDTIEHGRLAAERWADIFSEEDGRVWTPREAARMVTVHCDASGKAGTANSPASNVQYLRELGFDVRHPSANPRVYNRVFSVQKLLGENNLLFDPACKKTIKCFAEQALDKNGAPDKKKGLDHGPDCVGYGVWMRWPATRPRGNLQLVQNYG
ncbi:MAG: hypothetical protein ACPG6R_10920 [Aequoribacter sp.]|uniref:hypothetical protein n=1 Tax=Aequoribacter sp. TaxID=2847771 RepID=UPI003C635C80